LSNSEFENPAEVINCLPLHLLVVDNQEFEQNVYEELVELYGPERVQREAKLPKVPFFPDFVVYEDASQDAPLLVVEAKSGRESEYRQRRDIETLRELLEKSGADFGATVGPDFRYIFTWDESTGEWTTLDTFPGTVQASGSLRSLDSPSEARFVLNQFVEDANITFGGTDRDRPVVETFQCLLYKLVAERTQYNIDLDGDVEAQLADLQRRTRNEFEAVDTANLPTPDPNLARTVFSHFRGFGIDTTSDAIVQAFVESLVRRGKIGESQTYENIAQSLVAFADIRPETTVLDPASGVGVLCREAAQTSESVTGVEIQGGLVVIATFLNELSPDGDSIRSICGDFFELLPDTNPSHQSTLTTQQTSNDLGNSEYDRILLNPPVGPKIDADTAPEIGRNRSSIRIEEAFIARSLDLLSDDGLLVALVPEYILSGERSQALRDQLLERTTIESIVTFGQGVLPETSYRGAVVKLRQQYGGQRQRIETADVSIRSDHEGPRTLGDAFELINAGHGEVVELHHDDVRTLLPSQIKGDRRALDRITEEYGDFVLLGDAANISSGTRVPPSQTDADESAERLPYLDTDPDTDFDSLSDYPRSAASVVATPDDILITTKGKENTIYRPNREVIPSSRWAVIRPDTDISADRIAEFLQSDIGRDVLKPNRTGSAIPYISVKSLRELPIPDFGKTNGG
jgi:tRNA1(Val) A37 N6-methylase TrmN6